MKSILFIGGSRDGLRLSFPNRFANQVTTREKETYLLRTISTGTRHSYPYYALEGLGSDEEIKLLLANYRPEKKK
jgi:hypothetical protein